jgi:hypothetical protein
MPRKYELKADVKLTRSAIAKRNKNKSPWTKGYGLTFGKRGTDGHRTSDQRTEETRKDKA